MTLLEQPRQLALWALFLVMWGRIVYQDSLTQHISNRLVAAGIVLLAFLGFPAYGGASYTGFLLHVPLCLAAALTLWYLGIWPAGDAKLFVMLGTMLLLMLPAPAWNPLERVIVHLVNIFVPGAVLVLGGIVLHLIRNDSDLRRRLIGLYVLRWMPGHAKRSVGDVVAGVSRVLVMYLLMLWALAFFGRKAIIPIILASWAAAYPLNWLMSLGRLRALGAELALLAAGVATAVQVKHLDIGTFVRDAGRMLLVTWALQFIVVLVRESLETLETEQVDPQSLRPRQRLSEGFLAKLKADPAFDFESFGRLYADGLLPSQADTVKRYCAARGLAAVSISRSYPFAHWMFIGTLLTLALERDVVSLFTHWISR